MALAHLILRIVYHILTNQATYEELGDDYLPNRVKPLDYWVHKIEAEGFTVQLQPKAIA